MLTGGGKDRKIILWDHELRADRDIEVGHSHTLEHKPLLFDLRMTPFVRSCVSVCVCVDRSQISMGPSELYQRGREMNSWSGHLVISS